MYCLSHKQTKALLHIKHRLKPSLAIAKQTCRCMTRSSRWQKKVLPDHEKVGRGDSSWQMRLPIPLILLPPRWRTRRLFFRAFCRVGQCSTTHERLICRQCLCAAVGTYLFSNTDQGKRLYLMEGVELENAGVVGEDPVVSGQFQNGNSASSPLPSVGNRLAQMVRTVKGNGTSITSLWQNLVADLMMGRLCLQRWKPQKMALYP